MRMETGVCVLHLFLSPPADGRSVDVDGATATIEWAREHDCQVVTAAMLGHKGDIAVMGLSPDVTTLRHLQTGLQKAGLEVVDSYLSITEVSEYAPGLPEEMLNARLYPQLPPEGKPAFCFYPMSKRREAHANWYATDYDTRKAMMYEHGSSGRKFAGRIVQLITGSTGLDEHEWGVTLFGENLEAIKDVVYTLRFDQASSIYGEFGDFYVGYLADIAEVI